MNINLIINRLQAYFQVITNVELAKKLDVSPTAISNWKARNTIDYELILTKCEGINYNWLLTGEGEMLKSLTLINKEKPSKRYAQKEDDSIVVHEKVPVYNLEAATGAVAIFDNLHKQIPIDYIEIPNLPDCDGAVYIVGDSMYPLLKSGDIVVYKVLNDKANIFWGEMYLLSIVLDGDSFIAVKYIHRSGKKGYVKLVSHNSNHQENEIPLDAIKYAALIKASIRINCMG